MVRVFEAGGVRDADLVAIAVTDGVGVTEVVGVGEEVTESASTQVPP